ncbi:MAG: PHB depolymerase family esterase [Proteobacteria bacterium]|nr:PHB depolymerase family esterase [Pseudomonadota bacterium]
MKLPFPQTLTEASTVLQRVLGDAAPNLAQLRAKLPDALRHAFEPKPPSQQDSRFLSLSYDGPEGSRPYKLYVPSGYHGQPVPLIVMLHGCTQSPDDFAAGTRMNEAAEAQTCFVVWPQQVKSANMHGCWNWFRSGDQQRGRGEPAIIAGITHQIMTQYSVDPRRVYVAGLSAGGAAAAIMGESYPDVFAAVGVHSGLPCGAAHDMSSAMKAMKHGSRGIIPRAGSGLPPAIVFHGAADNVVHPTNGDAVVAQAAGGARLHAQAEDGATPGGHAWRRTLYRDADGMVKIEHWLVRGSGHAWSGGNPAGTYTDPRGPDATTEMLRFFLAHPK